MDSEFNLYRPFQRRGRWWLPANPVKSVAGTIKFDPRGACKLKLDGSLWATGPGEQTLGRADVVCGETSDGRDCTLIETFEAARRYSGTAVESSRVVFNRLLIGDGLCDPSTTCFRFCTADVAGLGEWMARDPISGTAVLRHASSVDGRGVIYTPPDPVHIPVPSLDASISIEPRISEHYSYRARRIEYREKLVIRPREPKPHQWHLDVVDDFRELLDLFLNRIAPIGSITLYSGGDSGDCDNKSEWSARHDLCFRPVGPLYDRKQHKEQVPFPYSVLAEDVQGIVNRWFLARAMTNTLARLQFGVSAKNNLPPEFRFLALMQGLESFHGVTHASQHAPGEECNAVGAVMERGSPPQVPLGPRASRQPRPKNRRTYTLRKKMNELVDGLPGALREAAFGDCAMSVARIVDSRNYIVHRDESLRARSMTPAELIRVANRLDLLASYHLLRQAGLSAELLERQMTQHPAFRRNLW